MLGACAPSGRLRSTWVNPLKLPQRRYCRRGHRRRSPRRRLGRPATVTFPAASWLDDKPIATGELKVHRVDIRCAWRRQKSGAGNSAVDQRFALRVHDNGTSDERWRRLRCEPSIVERPGRRTSARTREVFAKLRRHRGRNMVPPWSRAMAVRCDDSDSGI